MVSTTNENQDLIIANLKQTLPMHLLINFQNALQEWEQSCLQDSTPYNLGDVEYDFFIQGIEDIYIHLWVNSEDIEFPDFSEFIF